MKISDVLTDHINIAVILFVVILCHSNSISVIAICTPVPWSPSQPSNQLSYLPTPIGTVVKSQ